MCVRNPLEYSYCFGGLAGSKLRETEEMIGPRIVGRLTDLEPGGDVQQRIGTTWSEQADLKDPGLMVMIQ
jgi:hypothetical protein